MGHNNLPHIKRVTSRRQGKCYLYFETGVKGVDGKRIYRALPDIKDPSFGATYASFVAGRTRRTNVASAMNVTKLIELYKNGDKYKRLAPSTKKLYDIHLVKVEASVGNAPVNELEPRDVTRMMDEIADKPGTANMIMSVTGALYKWARQRQHVLRHVNPVADIEPFALGSHKPWPVNILNDALAAENDRLRLSAHLLYYTAQRIGDVCQLRWNDVRGNIISVVQDKTNKPLEIVIHSALAAELARTPRVGMTILATSKGAPIKDNAIRQALKAHCATYGLNLVPHGLRKNAVIALLEAGCTVAETAAVSGQSFQMVEYYGKMRDQKTMSGAAILKWENGK